MILDCVDFVVLLAVLQVGVRIGDIGLCWSCDSFGGSSGGCQLPVLLSAGHHFIL